ncbi:MAG: sigma-70 family RNA polymerase sigma factor [Candidatus Levybacteria bacterium]|nr:sigma-70 family RNA polymerase sigma factor [Candidatus Levybacteria bacterium]
MIESQVVVGPEQQYDQIAPDIDIPDQDSGGEVISLEKRPAGEESVVGDSWEQFQARLHRYTIFTPDQERFVFTARQQGLSLEAVMDSSLFEFPEGSEKAEKFGNAFADSRTVDDFIVICNLPLVVSISRGYRGEYMDLVQEGVIGLLKAIERFDPDRGNKFSTYATPWIRREIMDYKHRKQRLIRISRRISEGIASVSAFINGLNGVTPTEDELFEELIRRGYSVYEAEDIVKYFPKDKPPVSLTTELRRTRNQVLTLADTIPDPSTPTEDNIVNRVTLVSALRSMDVLSAQVAVLRFGLDDSCGEIGRALGISRHAVRRLEPHIIERLREMLKVIEPQDTPGS